MHATQTNRRKVPYNKREAKQCRKALFRTVTAARLDNIGPIGYNVPPDSSGTDNVPGDNINVNGTPLPTREALAKMMMSASLDNVGLHPGDARVEILARQHRRHSRN